MRADVTERGVVLEGTVAPATIVYVDRDWLPPISGPVPYLAVTENGTITFGASTTTTEGHADSDTTAALVLIAVARDAAEAVANLPPGAVDVVGSGLIATMVRRLVGDDPSPSAERPSAIVEGSGDPEAFVDATRRVADLGKVVLMGEALGRRMDVNLYTDVHVRGLTLVGVAPPLQRAMSFDPAGDDVALLTTCRESLGRVGSGTPLRSEFSWYAVTG